MMAASRRTYAPSSSSRDPEKLVLQWMSESSQQLHEHQQTAISHFHHPLDHEQQHDSDDSDDNLPLILNGTGGSSNSNSTTITSRRVSVASADDDLPIAFTINLTSNRLQNNTGNSRNAANGSSSSASTLVASSSTASSSLSLGEVVLNQHTSLTNDIQASLNETTTTTNSNTRITNRLADDFTELSWDTLQTLVDAAKDYIRLEDVVDLLGNPEMTLTSLLRTKDSIDVDIRGLKNEIVYLESLLFAGGGGGSTSGSGGNGGMSSRSILNELDKVEEWVAGRGGDVGVGAGSHSHWILSSPNTDDIATRMSLDADVSSFALTSVTGRAPRKKSLFRRTPQTPSSPITPTLTSTSPLSNTPTDFQQPFLDLRTRILASAVKLKGFMTRDEALQKDIDTATKQIMQLQHLRERMDLLNHCQCPNNNLNNRLQCSRRETTLAFPIEHAIRSEHTRLSNLRDRASNLIESLDAITVHLTAIEHVLNESSITSTLLSNSSGSTGSRRTAILYTSNAIDSIMISVIEVYNKVFKMGMELGNDVVELEVRKVLRGFGRLEWVKFETIVVVGGGGKGKGKGYEGWGGIKCDNESNRYWKGDEKGVVTSSSTTATTTTTITMDMLTSEFDHAKKLILSCIKELKTTLDVDRGQIMNGFMGNVEKNLMKVTSALRDERKRLLYGAIAERGKRLAVEEDLMMVDGGVGAVEGGIVAGDGSVAVGGGSGTLRRSRSARRKSVKPSGGAGKNEEAMETDRGTSRATSRSRSRSRGRPFANNSSVSTRGDIPNADADVPPVPPVPYEYVNQVTSITTEAGAGAGELETRGRRGFGYGYERVMKETAGGGVKGAMSLMPPRIQIPEYSLEDYPDAGGSASTVRSAGVISQKTPTGTGNGNAFGNGSLVVNKDLGGSDEEEEDGDESVLSDIDSVNSDMPPSYEDTLMVRGNVSSARLAPSPLATSVSTSTTATSLSQASWSSSSSITQTRPSMEVPRLSMDSRRLAPLITINKPSASVAGSGHHRSLSNPSYLVSQQQQQQQQQSQSQTQPSLSIQGRSGPSTSSSLSTATSSSVAPVSPTSTKKPKLFPIPLLIRTRSQGGSSSTAPGSGSGANISGPMSANDVSSGLG
ncbi:hypothetical protein HDU76_005851, partial [Blyttiomyces sp. JEL0837]